jgi:hypothetical protein
MRTCLRVLFCATVVSPLACSSGPRDARDAPDPNFEPTGVTAEAITSGGACASGPADATFGTYVDALGNTHTIVGCHGKVSWPNRASLCSAGSVPVSASSWALVAGAVPVQNDYWVNDALGYTGQAGACEVGLGLGFASCRGSPMRVCTPTGTDPEGNVCNWTGCTYAASSNAQVGFGGCIGNTTAGTLCDGISAPANVASACAQGSTPLQYFGTYADSTGATREVVGCSGAVGWNTMQCGAGWEPAPSLAWTLTYANAGLAPTHTYWTSDNLGYGGSGSGSCSAAVGLNSCGVNDPMRVCPSSGNDADGNRCNWTNCSDGSGTTPMYYGGCVGNMTAGVLCQPIAPSGPNHRPIAEGGFLDATLPFPASCGISPSSGVLNCWGQYAWQDSEIRTTTPAPVQGLPSPITAASSDGKSLCAVTGAGAILCQGLYTGDGLYGNGTLSDPTPSIPSPVGMTSAMADVVIEAASVCGLSQAGAVSCWGSGTGNFGTGSAPPMSNQGGWLSWASPTPVVGLQGGVTAIALSTEGMADVLPEFVSACALTTAGAVWCWGMAGESTDGVLGDGSTTFPAVPVQVPGLPNIVAISSGYRPCALSSTGTVYCWGYAEGAPYGLGSATPVAIQGLPPGIQGLAQGTPNMSNFGGWPHQCAWTTYGVWCWGGNSQGELGNGTTAWLSASAVQVQGLPSGVVSYVAVGGMGGENWTCAVVGGHEYCWGSDDLGVLGNTTFNNDLTPMPVPGM